MPDLADLTLSHRKGVGAANDLVRGPEAQRSAAVMMVRDRDEALDVALKAFTRD